MSKDSAAIDRRLRKFALDFRFRKLLTKRKTLSGHWPRRSDTWHSRRENLNHVLSFANAVGVQVHAQQEGFYIPWDERSFDKATIVNVIEHLHESP